MASREEVERFLTEFRIKLSVWGVWARDDRGKHTKTLGELDLTGSQRMQVLMNLSAFQYCQGPLPDKLNNGADLWVFGSIIKSKEIYIKVTLGFKEAPVHCISFHIAEKPLQYPFK